MTYLCVDEQETGDEGSGDGQPREVVTVFLSMCGGGDLPDEGISVCEESGRESENESGGVLPSSMMVRCGNRKIFKVMGVVSYGATRIGAIGSRCHGSSTRKARLSRLPLREFISHAPTVQQPQWRTTGAIELVLSS